MAFGWKRLIPISLVWIVAVAFIRKLRNEDMLDQQALFVAAGVAAAVLLVSLFIPERRRDDDTAAHLVGPDPQGSDDADEDGRFDGGYPVPPMPESTWNQKEDQRR